ncbi:MAG: hypothetical protein II886_08115 [Prevotella sp.]|nr:hypothetical protein [Prevotella sp.]
MAKKTGGMPYMVYASPKKGQDGRNIVYVRPEGGPRMKLNTEQIDALCAKYGAMRSGELQLVMKEFMHWAAEWLVKGYRVETPLGSFAPKLRLKREITDPDDVQDCDVELDGIDFTPAKLWDEELQHWKHDGFRKSERLYSSEPLADMDNLEQMLHRLLEQRGYVTVNIFKASASLTYHSARELLNKWCEGENPKLQKTRMGNAYIYTEI